MNQLAEVKNKAGKNVVGYGNVDFLESKYKIAHKTKSYNFSKYATATTTDKKEENPKWKPNKVKFAADERGDIDPVQTDTTDSSYFFNNSFKFTFRIIVYNIFCCLTF